VSADGLCGWEFALGDEPAPLLGEVAVLLGAGIGEGIATVGFVTGGVELF
jgi:hypothetical protein